MSKPFRLTLIHPCIGRRRGEEFIRLWQMEPLPAAVIAALTPKDVAIRFYDDRVEPIPFDEPTDLVAISIETYTAKRAYQIASEFRRRNVPVVMGGFHASLCPDEVAQYAEAVVIGEAENLWTEVLDDFRTGTPKKFYRTEDRPSLAASTPDRSIFEGKNYLPVRLIENGRGCPLRCEFCAIQTVYQKSQTRRPVEDVIAELEKIKKGAKIIFFVDDNMVSHPEAAKELFRRLIPLKIRWMTQAAITVAYDEEMLDLMRRSGCIGVLIGFESLNPETLKSMDKTVNTREANYTQALANLTRYGLRVYASLVFGYDQDTPDTFDRAIEFTVKNGFFLTGFAHLTPFPGTPLYKRLEAEKRLLYPAWWLDDAYSYTMVPFRPALMTPEAVHDHARRARREFYSWKNIFRRFKHPVNLKDPWMWLPFLSINVMHRRDHHNRDHYPLGDESWTGTLIKAQS